MKPIYKPKGKAAEYCEYALNIYTGCPHRCWFCYCPSVLRRDREVFFSDVKPRKNIVEETKKQLLKEGVIGKLVHLCFVGDPYPTGYDTTPTRAIIKLLKEFGNNVQILTKGIEPRDIDLLGRGDWFGVTITGEEDPEVISDRMNLLRTAHLAGVGTWISFEPVLFPEPCIKTLEEWAGYIDGIKIGKLNYHEPPVRFSMAEFVDSMEKICRDKCVFCYVKKDTAAAVRKEKGE